MNVSHKILLKNLLIEGHYTQVDYKQERSEMDVEKTQSIAGACREERKHSKEQCKKDGDGLEQSAVLHRT